MEEEYREDMTEHGGRIQRGYDGTGRENIERI